MKKIFRKIAIYTFILFLLPQFIPGFGVDGGIQTYFIGGVGLTIIFMILKPILRIISFPINFLTLGLFSMFINALLLYVLTLYIKNITVSPFSYPPVHYMTYTIPKVSFSQVPAYILVAFIISFLESLLFLFLG